MPPTARRQRLDRQRLRHAGHALEQHVAPGQQRDEHPLDQAVLTDDDALDLEQHPLQPGGVGRRRTGAGAGEVSIGVLAALLTDLPGRAGPRPRAQAAVDGDGRPPPRQCPTPDGQSHSHRRSAMREAHAANLRVH